MQTWLTWLGSLVKYLFSMTCRGKRATLNASPSKCRASQMTRTLVERVLELLLVQGLIWALKVVINTADGSDASRGNFASRWRAPTFSPCRKTCSASPHLRCLQQGIVGWCSPGGAENKQKTPSVTSTQTVLVSFSHVLRPNYYALNWECHYRMFQMSLSANDFALKSIRSS